jgi:hypothetical protein
MPVKDLVLHLRLHWQVMLAPLFLWGFVLSAGTRALELITPRFWLVFLIFHVLFYGGATALNSYYDQDEGPVGGLWDPPKVTRDLLVFSVSLQVIGLALLPFISLPLFGLALVMGVVGNAYSHPAIRLKAHPWSSLLAVSVFQGMGGTAAGWLFATEDWQTLFSWQGRYLVRRVCGGGVLPSGHRLSAVGGGLDGLPCLARLWPSGSPGGRGRAGRTGGLCRRVVAPVR